MQVRIIYTYRKGFRRRRIATSLLDTKEYPAAELSNIYHLRWNIETFYREFKSTMDGNHWHCGKVESFKIEFLSKMILCCMTRLAVIESISKSKLSVTDISFAAALLHYKYFLMELIFHKRSTFKELWTKLLKLLKGNCRAVIKPGRIFSRDKQTYRKKSRALLRNKVGRPAKKRKISPSEESRPQTMLSGGITKSFKVLVV